MRPLTFFKSAAGVCGVVIAVGAIPASAQTACTTNSQAEVYAGAGQVCNTPGGNYAPTSDNGFMATGGGVITSLRPATITMPNTQSVYGIFSTGTGSSVNTAVGQTITTSGAGSAGVLANQGGSVTLGAGSIAATGTPGLGVDAMGIFATGTGTNVTATGVAVTTSGTAVAGGATANGIAAENGATMSFTGGSVTSNGNGSIGATALTGGTLTLNGTTFNANANGTQGLYVGGTGSTLTGTGLTITSSGTTDSVTGFTSGAASNNGFGSVPTGGVMKLTNSTLLSTGANSYGVYTANGGVTTLTNDSVTIRTTGGVYAGPAVQSDVGGSTTISGGSVTSNASNPNAAAINAIAVYSTGAGATVTIDNGAAISVTGLRGQAIRAEGGGSVTMTGGTVTAGGVDSAGAGSVSGGSVTLTGTTVTASGNGSTGLYANGATASVTGTNLTIKVTGGFDGVNNNNVVGVFNGGFESYVGGGTISLTNSTISASQSNSIGVNNQDSGSMTVAGGSITVNGSDSVALYSLSNATTKLTGTTILATAVGGAGVNVGSGSSFTGSNLTITTQGAEDSATGAGSHAILNGSTSGLTGGTVTLSNSTLSTAGYDAAAVTNRNGGTFTDTGSTIKTLGDESDALLATNGSTTNLTGTQITTSGNGSKGLNVQSAATLTGQNLTITTSGSVNTLTGNHAQGVYNGASNPASAGSTGGGTVTLTNSTISTSGVDASGVESSNGGLTTLNGGSVTTTGVASGVVGALYGGVTKLDGTTVSATANGAPGLFVNGTGSELDATGVTVTTAGNNDPNSGFDADGAYNGTSGAITGGGVLNLTNSKISTQGSTAVGVQTESGGVTTISGGTFTTSGSASYAVASSYAGFTSITGATISTTGNGSGGLSVNGAGSELDATNVTVTTTGALDTVSGQHSYGAYNGPFGANEASGGVLKLTNSSITTSGLAMHGVITGDGGVTTISGGSVTTSGNDAFGVYAMSGAAVTTSGGLKVTTTGQFAYGFDADNGGSLTDNGSTITTRGNQASGVYAVSGSTVSLTGTQIDIHGLGAQALNVGDAATRLVGANLTINVSGGYDPTYGDYSNALYNGPRGSATSTASVGGNVTLTNSTLTTSDDNAAALYTVNQGVTTINGGTIATSGASASGVVSQYGGVTNLNQATVTTTGAKAYGVASLGGSTTTLNGVNVSTAGQGAHALYVSGANSVATIEGSSTFTTSGAGAVGLYAIGGGVINASGATTITTTGGALAGTPISQAYGIVADGVGSEVNLSGPTTINAAGGAFYLADTTNTGSTGTITLSGPLNLTTSGTSAAAITLTGPNTTFAATGGGTITTAGTTIAFINGANATATFDNFTIRNASGDLIYADPSSATINFNSTTADAGSGTLLDATNTSNITLNANNSNITGVMTTDATSESTVNLTNGSTWTMTGSSNVSSLSVNNSAVVFSAPTNGAYKTLTAGSYSGNGATMTMNAVLGGTGSPADHLTLGSSPTGATSLVIRNVGGPGAQTTGAGIPLISTSSGVIPASAFTLQNLVVVGGYQYNLTGAGTDQESLVSVPTTTTAQATSSVASVAQSKESQTVTGRQLNSILLGANEQINCTSCSSGFASVGSFAIGAHGRWTINKDLSLLAGFSFDEYSAPGVQVNSAYNIAGGVRYDVTEMGSSRPFFEAGAAISPYQSVSYTRNYVYGSTIATGTGSSTDRALALYGRAGWVDRLTPIDEAAIYVDLTRSWQTSTGYSEQQSASNPYAATFSSGVDTLNIARVAVQYTHLFFDKWEVNGTAGLAHGFSASYTGQADLDGFGIISAAAPGAFSWAELGGRVGYRFSDRIVIDGFVIGTLGPQPVGDTIHGGLGLRYAF